MRHSDLSFVNAHVNIRICHVCKLISEFVPPAGHLDLLRQFLRRRVEEQEFLRAYLECSDEAQQAVREMLQVLEEPSTSEEQRQMAISTIADALFQEPA